jgi:hypothetical protein
MFGRHTDYHGTRRYGPGGPASSTPGGLGLRSSLAIAWLKLQVEKFLRAGAPASTSTLLMRGDEKHFTTLGGPSQERPISDLFPVEADGERGRAGRRSAH